MALKVSAKDPKKTQKTRLKRISTSSTVSATKKSTRGIKRKSTATNVDDNRRVVADVPGKRGRKIRTSLSDRELAKWEKNLSELGNERDELFNKHREIVAELRDLISDALKADVPVALISDWSGIARQQIYTIK